MKTNRTIWLRRATIIIVGAWVTTQAPAMADTAPVKSASQQAGQVKAPGAEQASIMLASLSCTRVGNRMVC